MSIAHLFPRAARLASIAAVVALAAGCATTASSGSAAAERTGRGATEYAEYEAFAGAPVQQFPLRGALSSWNAIGDSAVAVTTSPSRTFLLDLSGPCDELRSAIAIGLTSRNGIVSAKFDKVLPRTSNPIQIPCHIAKIRPVDEKAMRAARRGEGVAPPNDPGLPPPPPAQPSGT